MKTILTLALLLGINSYTFSQIKTYNINQTLIGPSSITLDIDSNSTDDFTFDILTLSPGTYAARVLPVALTSILDNSTFGYADALNFGDPVTGYFNTGTGILGTIAGAGQFNGMGIKYLGFKINLSGMDHYGWFKLNCSTNRDTLIIISVGFNTIANAPITAGQTTSLAINETSSNSHQSIQVYPNPASNFVIVNTEFEMIDATVIIHNALGQEIHSFTFSSGRTLTFSTSLIDNGYYTLSLTNANGETASVKFVVNHN